MSAIPRTVCAFAIVLFFAFPAAVQAQEGSYDFSVAGRSLDALDELGVTGSPVDVDPVTWRLAVNGAAAQNPTSLSYGQLAAMPRVNRVSLLICPGFFEDVAEWGGVPVADLLALAGVSPSWKEIVVTSVDGYPALFSRAEVDAHVFFVALTVNGQRLPREHGFPARLVAEGLLGGRWVKWIASIEVR
jgi:DMSO/TMAO reductase YedYZ molybdopterin-dependent catalytic subunit